MLTDAHGGDVKSGEWKSDEEPDEVVPIQTLLALSNEAEEVDEVSVHYSSEQGHHQGWKMASENIYNLPFSVKKWYF